MSSSALYAAEKDIAPYIGVQSFSIEDAYVERCPTCVYEASYGPSESSWGSASDFSYLDRREEDEFDKAKKAAEKQAMKEFADKATQEGIQTEVKELATKLCSMIGSKVSYTHEPAQKASYSEVSKPVRDKILNSRTERQGYTVRFKTLVCEGEQKKIDSFVGASLLSAVFTAMNNGALKPQAAGSTPAQAVSNSSGVKNSTVPSQSPSEASGGEGSVSSASAQ